MSFLSLRDRGSDRRGGHETENLVSGGRLLPPYPHRPHRGSVLRGLKISSRGGVLLSKYFMLHNFLEKAKFFCAPSDFLLDVLCCLMIVGISDTAIIDKGRNFVCKY